MAAKSIPWLEPPRVAKPASYVKHIEQPFAHLSELTLQFDDTCLRLLVDTPGMCVHYQDRMRQIALLATGPWLHHMRRKHSGMVTSREIMKVTGIENVATLVRWHQMGLIPPPVIGTHPNGKGKIGRWPLWVLFWCGRIRELRKLSFSLDTIKATYQAHEASPR